MKKLMLHFCCACCGTAVLERLNAEYEIFALFFNPNIYPSDEYFFREQELEKFLENYPNIKLIKSEYNTKDFYNAVYGLEKDKEGGMRCIKCYELRLEKTAQLAKEYNCDLFTTTLSISPHKNADKLNQIGNGVASKYGVKHLDSNFKKNNGFKRSCEISQQYNMYRQNYCGCEFSIR